MRKLLSFVFLLLMLLVSAIRCSDSDQSGDDSLAPGAKFVPTDVVIKTDKSFTIQEVFQFINGFDHDVESITNGVYNSDLPSDSLQYVLEYLNAKPYTQSGEWKVGGYLHYQTNQITIFPRLYQMKDEDYQQDWLQTMDEVKLSENTVQETSGYVIYFHVPPGTEKEWVRKFKQYDFVAWAELNYILDLNPHP